MEMDQGILYRKNMRCLDTWMWNKENGKWIADYLHAHHMQQIGIYGYGILGRHLVWELLKKEYSIAWVMDRSSSGDEIYSKIVKPEKTDHLEDVDMAVITALTAVEEAEAFLLRFVKGKIVSMQELVASIYAWGNQS